MFPYHFNPKLDNFAYAM
uniref:Uncharacterized protein n=1 Tax=Arundo donax TaxID=35708 RepID=A0A0A8ZES4_ARUDO